MLDEFTTEHITSHFKASSYSHYVILYHIYVHKIAAVTFKTWEPTKIFNLCCRIRLLLLMWAYCLPLL
jgi:hypothetical protein